MTCGKCDTCALYGSNPVLCDDLKNVNGCWQYQKKMSLPMDEPVVKHSTAEALTKAERHARMSAWQVKSAKEDLGIKESTIDKLEDWELVEYRKFPDQMQRIEGYCPGCGCKIGGPNGVRGSRSALCYGCMQLKRDGKIRLSRNLLSHETVLIDDPTFPYGHDELDEAWKELVAEHAIWEEVNGEIRIVGYDEHARDWMTDVLVGRGWCYSHAYAYTKNCMRFEKNGGKPRFLNHRW